MALDQECFEINYRLGFNGDPKQCDVRVYFLVSNCRHLYLSPGVWTADSGEAEAEAEQQEEEEEAGILEPPDTGSLATLTIVP